jgi:twitching motility protein PilT
VPTTQGQPIPKDAPTQQTQGTAQPQPVRKLLHELKFTDIYLRIDEPERPRYQPMPSKDQPPCNIPVPFEYAESLERLRKKLMSITKDDFTIMHEGLRLRTSRMTVMNDQEWCVMRRVAGSLPTLEQLQIRPPLSKLLRSLGTRSGLVIICGSTGNGKTTTGVSLMADYLKRFGQTALTLEDPIEYNLQGEHGETGYCFQVEVEKEEDWAKGLMTGLRWHPRYFFVGEIRNAESAAQVLRAATSGHLVITTLHAGSIEEALSNLVQISEQILGDRAAEQCADALTAVIHQRLGAFGPSMKVVVTEKGNAGDPVRNCVRENTMKLLGTQVDMQTKRFVHELQGKPPKGTS